MLTQRPPNSNSEHLLWALMELKLYHIESVNSTLVGVTEKTFRKWFLSFIRLLANLSVVSTFFVFLFLPDTLSVIFIYQFDWDSRYYNAPLDTEVLFSLDGTDFRIMEPSVFDPK